MASSQTILKINKKSQESIISYLWQLRSRFTFFYGIRDLLETIDREYYREANRTEEHMKARLANKLGDAHKYQDITMPIVLDQVDTFTGFLTDVFCSSTPIFPVIAPKDYADAAVMMNSILDNQSKKGSWKSELIKFFRDCGKYNLAAVEVDWAKVNTALVETDLTFSPSQGRPRNIIWEGNKLKHLSLYNTFWDTTVPAQEVHKDGEFAGYHELYSRNKLKKLIAELGDDAIIENIVPAYNSGTQLNQYYIPQINRDSLVSTQTAMQGMDWFAWAGIKPKEDAIASKGLYLVTKLYARILPSDFGIRAPQPNTPQVWKFIIVNFSEIIYCERQTNAHEYIPILFGCPNDDGIKYQSKSLAQNAMPFQQISSSLMNSAMAARRKAIYDRGLYNPLYVAEKTINSDNPVAKIPIKPTAYQGVPLNEIYMPIPFNDNQSGLIMQEAQMISGIADQVSGLNKAQRGQFVKGNKTGLEFNEIMKNSDVKPRMAAIVLEDQVMTPMKFILGINIIQFQGNETLYYEEGDAKSAVSVDPLLIRNAIWKFKVTDGAAPKEAEMHEDTWQTALQMFATSPAIAQEYQVSDVFSYLLKMKGADIADFRKPKEVLMYEQATAAWQNTIQMILKANPQATQEQWPPQPKPQDYGLNPDGTPANKDTDESKETLVQQIIEASQGAERQVEGNEVM